MRPTVKIEGLKQLDAALGELTKATARAVTRRALLKAAEPMVQAAKQFAPVGDVKGAGNLRDSIAASATSVAGNDAYAKALHQGRGQAGAVKAKRDALRSLKGGALSVIFVGPARKKGSRATKIAHLLEFGAAAHVIEPKTADGLNRLSFTSGNQRYRPTVVSHPGAKPHPFMRPAFEESKGEVFNLIKVELTAELARAAERARRKALRQKA